MINAIIHNQHLFIYFKDFNDLVYCTKNSKNYSKSIKKTHSNIYLNSTDYDSNTTYTLKILIFLNSVDMITFLAESKNKQSIQKEAIYCKYNFC